MNDLIELENTRTINESIEDVRGVKGRCILSNAQYFNPVQSTCIDYMHSVLEGVCKNLLKYWFDLPSTNEFSIKKFSTEINLRLKNIKPPKFVPSTPRSIYDHSKWKAHEYLAFFIYYALPVFFGIMKSEYFDNLKKFSITLEILLEKNIKKNELEMAQSLFNECVSEFEELYGESFMLSGAHELLHLTQCTIEFGPLNLINSFQFEELNRKLINLIKGNDLVGEEFIKVFTVGQVLSTYISNEKMNTPVREFYEKFKCFKTSNRKNNNNKLEKNILIKLDKQIICNDSVVLEAWNKFQGTSILESIETHKKISFNGILYSSISSSNKRCDFCVRNKKNNFGLIVCFIIFGSDVFVICKRLISLYSPFNVLLKQSNIQIASKIVICDESEQLFVEHLSNIEKVCFVKIDKEHCYVSSFKTSHLFN
jgi:hypothetical protein